MRDNIERALARAHISFRHMDFLMCTVLFLGVFSVMAPENLHTAANTATVLHVVLWILHD